MFLPINAAHASLRFLHVSLCFDSASLIADGKSKCWWLYPLYGQAFFVHLDSLVYNGQLNSLTSSGVPLLTIPSSNILSSRAFLYIVNLHGSVIPQSEVFGSIKGVGFATKKPAVG